MGPAGVQDVRNYTLLPAGPAGRTRPHARPIPIASAVYDPAAQAVTLTLRRRLALHGYYRLTVNAAPPAGLRAADGAPLDGSGTGRPGSDYVALVHGYGAVSPKAHAAVNARQAAAAPGGPLAVARGHRAAR
jgi:hypothetical protein